jgi:plasmid stability protein
MASMLLRNLDSDLLDALKERATKHGRSVQQELHVIVREAVAPDVARAERRAYYERAKAINDRLAAAGRRMGDSTFDIRMDRDSNHRRF